MDKIEHELATSGWAIEQRAEQLRPLVAQVAAVDAALSADLERALAAADEVVQALVRIASTWHGVAREGPDG